MKGNVELCKAKSTEELLEELLVEAPLGIPPAILGGGDEAAKRLVFKLLAEHVADDDPVGPA